MRSAPPPQSSSRTAPPGQPGQPGQPGRPGRRDSSAAWRIAFGLYTWLEFLVVGLAGLGLLLCVGPLARRRALTRRLARLVLRLAGMRLHVGDLSGLPRPCVVVANHCSYLDGVVLCAALPPDFGFVIKREMLAVPLAGLLLRRIGAEFVERRNHARVMSDTRRLMRHAQAGQALAFFPEGTFSAEVGLLHFHIGAFAAAARANMAVAPIAIRGTRHCLPPDSAWPRPGPIDVRALAALPALAREAADDSAGGNGARAAVLRDRARSALLVALGEPDLPPGSPVPLESDRRA